MILAAPGLLLMAIKIGAEVRGFGALTAALREAHAVCAARSLPLPAEGLGSLLRQVRLLTVSMVGVGLVSIFEIVLSVQGFLGAAAPVRGP